MITIAEAERDIIRVWNVWAAKRDLPEIGVCRVGHQLRDMDPFYRHLQTEHPHLLEFKMHGSNKFKRVMGWLQHSGCLKD